MTKKGLFFVLVLSLFLMLFNNNISYADGFPDTKNHWAGRQILRTVGEGIISGYPDRTFKPDKNISRVEFIAVINSIFNNQQKSPKKFNDLPAGNRISEEIAKGFAAGYISGYDDGTVRPEAYITRQEAAKIISVAFGLDNAVSDSYKGFNDAGKMQKWAMNGIGVLSDRGYINGYGNGEFKPDRFMTRAEAVAVLDKAAGEIIIGKDTYLDKTVPGNLLIHSPVTLIKNTTINGDLIIAQSNTGQNLVLDGITVKGRVYVKNNRLNSISVKDGSINEILLATQKAQGYMKIEGNAAVGKLTVLSTANISTGNQSRLGSMLVNAGSRLTITDNSEVKNVVLGGGADGTAIEAIPGVTIKNEAKKIFVNGVPVFEGTTFTTTDSLELINID